jgi:hypothetical protein
MAAKAFVNRGYTAAVLEENSGGSLMLVPSPGSLQLFIDMVTDMDNFPADTDQIMLARHSAGGITVLSYLQGRCPVYFTFCSRPQLPAIEPSNQIKAAGGFGTSLVNADFGRGYELVKGVFSSRRTDIQDADVPTNNNGFPFFIVTGENDPEVTDGTLEVLTPVNGLATIEGLGRDFILLESQVESAVAALASWFETSVAGTFDKTCTDLKKDVQKPRDTLFRVAKSIP